MSEDKDIFAPEFKTTPFWWEAAAPETGHTAAVPRETDVAVVGGGYTGLSAALELARRGTAVTVLEADAFGSGPSTRNGGLVGSTNVGKGASETKQSPVEKTLGKKRLISFLEAGAASLFHLENIIEREGIDCAYDRSGYFLGAYTPTHFEELRHKVDLINETGIQTAEMIPRPRQHEVIGTDYYHGGMAVSLAGGIHPALYHRGLLDACRRAGATLCADTKVTRIGKADGGSMLETANGGLKAREVVVATNGLTGQATPWLRRRLIPITSHMIATEKLPEDTVRSLLPRNHTVAETKRVRHYYRLSPDGRRVLFGGRASLGDAPPSVTAPILLSRLIDIFPQIRDVKVTHAWSGNVAFAFDFLPHMSRHGGIHYCAACNGAGVAMLSYLGHRTALTILGDEGASCIFEGQPFPTKPFYTGYPWFLPMVAGYFKLRDHVDGSSRNGT